MNFMRAVYLAVTAVCLTACASQPVQDHHYSLVLAADSTTTMQQPQSSGRMIIGPIRLARYLNQPGLAMQISDSEVRTANHHFWAEPLSEGIGKVLVRDIAHQLPQTQIARSATTSSDENDCQVEIEFDKFHATTNSEVVAAGRFWIRSVKSRSSAHEFSFTESLTTDGYSHAVRKLRNTLNTLASDIATKTSTPASTCIK